MIKSQLVLNVAGQLRRIRQRAAEEAVNAFLDRIVSASAHGDRLELRGSFSVKVRGGRVGRDPRTGAIVPVLEKKVCAFRPSREMHKRLDAVASMAKPMRSS